MEVNAHGKKNSSILTYMKSATKSIQKCVKHVIIDFLYYSWITSTLIVKTLKWFNCVCVKLNAHVCDGTLTIFLICNCKRPETPWQKIHKKSLIFFNLKKLTFPGNTPESFVLWASHQSFFFFAPEVSGFSTAQWELRLQANVPPNSQWNFLHSHFPAIILRPETEQVAHGSPETRWQPGKQMLSRLEW